MCDVKSFRHKRVYFKLYYSHKLLCTIILYKPHFYNNCIYLMLTIVLIFLNCRMQNNFASPQLILQYCKTDYSGDINSIKYLFNMLYGYLQAVIIKRLFLYSNNDPFLDKTKSSQDFPLYKKLTRCFTHQSVARKYTIRVRIRLIILFTMYHSNIKTYLMQQE